MKKPGNDVVRWYKKLISASVSFDLTYPMLGSFLLNVANERTAEDTDSLWLKNQEQGISFFQKKIEKQVEKKNISKKTDAEAIAYLMHRLSSGLLEWLTISHGVKLRDYVAENKPIDTIKDSDIKSASKRVGALIAAALN